jgi:predicted aconitase
MDNWKTMIGRGMWPGAAASLSSTVALALAGKNDSGSVFGATNAVSHWIYGDKAFRHGEPSLKYTLVGYAIHHASALFWATLFEQVAGKVLDRKDLRRTAAAAAAASAVACFVDYEMTPQRLKPGYERRLTTGSMALVYAAFGIGLAAGAMVNRRR